MRKASLCAVFSLAFSFAITALFLCPTAAQAAPIGWNVECNHTKFHAIDPITQAGGPGNPAHTHEFFGTRPRLDSTFVSQRLEGTNCSRQADTSGYWVPMAYRYTDGYVIVPKVVKEYYRGPEVGYQNVRPAPADLRIIAGDPMATSPQGGIVGWDCLTPSGNVYFPLPEPHNCLGGNDEIRANVVFPDCWNGYQLDSPDHKSHMAYSTAGLCPSTHPILIPQLTMSLVFPAYLDPGGAINWDGVYLANLMGDTGRYSLHADWWQTWQQGGVGGMNNLTVTCINAGISCSAF